MKSRHPEKENKPVNPIKKKPEWIRSKLTNSKEFFLTKTIVNNNNLVTVCQEANCPNITAVSYTHLTLPTNREV